MKEKGRMPLLWSRCHPLRRSREKRRFCEPQEINVARRETQVDGSGDAGRACADEQMAQSATTKALVGIDRSKSFGTIFVPSKREIFLG